MKIVNVVGARPNLMKIAPLMAEMRRCPGMVPVLIHTGQHYDDNMSRAFFRDLNLPQPDHNLGVGSGSHTVQTAQVMMGLEPLLKELKPDLVVAVGDVNSTLAAALVASKLGISLAHVEAGLRSFDRTMPEEINRVVTDALAEYLFVTEESAVKNLAREGIPGEKVHFVGNVMIDTLLQHKQMAESLEMPRRYSLPPQGYAVVTLHRPSNVDREDNLQAMVEVLSALQEELPVVMPLHPRTRKRLEEFKLANRVEALGGLRLMEPMGYLEFLGLVSQARMVITDSGGIQEETTILGVPCLTVRENTERPVTITHGTNRLAGTKPAGIIAAFREVMSGPAAHHRTPKLWDGKAAQRIVGILAKLAEGR